MRNNTMKRLLSLVAAVTLTAQTMTVMAFGAELTSAMKTLVSGTGTVGTAGAVDVFYCPAGVANATITGFEADKDWIAVDEHPIGIPAVTDVAGGAVLGNPNAPLVTVLGVSAASLAGRVVPATKPIIISASVSNTNVKEGDMLTLDANVVVCSGTPTYQWTLGGDIVAKTLTSDVNASRNGVYTLTVTNGGLSDTRNTNAVAVSCPATVTGVTVNGEDSKFSAAVAYAENGCIDPAHRPAGVTWAVDANSTALGITINNNGVVTLPEALAAGSYTVTATATSTKDTSKSGSGSLPFTVESKVVEECVNPRLESAAVTNDAGGNTVTLPQNGTKTVNYTFKPTYKVDSCNLPAHANDPTHGLSAVPVWSLAEAPSGVALNGNVLTIPANAPSGSIKVRATVNNVAARTLPTVAESAITFVREAPPTPVCNPVVTSLGLTPTGNTINVAAGGTATQLYTVSMVMTGQCTDPAHTAINHGVTPVWGVTNVAGVTMANGTVTVTANSLAAMSTPITVTATIPAANGGQTATVSSTVVRPGVCTLQLLDTNNTGAANFGSPVYGIPSGTNNPITDTTVNNKRVIKLFVRDETVTLPFTMGTGKPIMNTGVCEYRNANNEAACPNLNNHRVRWELDKAYSGISIDPATGVLTVNRRSLGYVETLIGVKAAIGGANGATTYYAAGYITVRNDRYSSDNDDDDYDSESVRNEEQWDKLEYQIEDADRKETISVNLGDNTKLPNHVIDTLEGRDVTVKLTVSGGYTWILNGKNVKKPPSYQIYIPLDVDTTNDKTIAKLAKYEDVLIFDLKHEGSFYGTYTLRKNLGSTYENKYVYLYKYNEDTKKLQYKGSAKVDDSGYVQFPFTSASSYVITGKALNGEKPGSTVGGTTGNTGGATVSPPAPSYSAPPPAASSQPASTSTSTSTSSSSSESSESSEPSSIEEPSSSSAEEISKPTETLPEEEEKPEKKSIPIIVPILIVVVVLTIVAVVLLAKGGGIHFGE